MSKGKHDMKAWLQNKWQRIKRVNPYLLALIIFLITFVFPSDYSVWNQIKLSRRISSLEKEKKELIENIETNKKGLEQLHSDKLMLEKFAREEFLMKEKDEDIYIIDGDK
ncbi:septum formation initiator family protein [Porphyromonadaceae bacterium W3.11]|nr:septum formation initiator family protein [Porphyromonadaceae bacterium W3.11]